MYTLLSRKTFEREYFSIKFCIINIGEINNNWHDLRAYDSYN